jgi:hypothetical protein
MRIDLMANPSSAMPIHERQLSQTIRNVGAMKNATATVIPPHPPHHSCRHGSAGVEHPNTAA